MEIITLQKFIEEGKSQRTIANELNISQATVKYWLKKFNLRTTGKQFSNSSLIPGFKICPRCNKDKPKEEFYNGGYCKKCMSEYTSERCRQIKIKLVEYKGGKCEKCKLIDDACVYDFHHRDPNEKDFEIGDKMTRKFDRLVEEVNKCALLCSPCHRKLHAGILTL